MTGIHKGLKILISFLILFSAQKVFSQLSQYQNGVVSSANEIASNVGIDILKKGGNAVDAAVGVGFALSVVYPQAGNIGGGGFMVIHLSSGINTSIDYREKAPALSGRNMFLDTDGNVIKDLSTTGNLSAGVPGSVAGMIYALEKYGTMKINEVISYAIELADTGFYINSQLAKDLNFYQSEFEKFPETKKIFGGVFREGDLFIQKDLANTLKRISDNGRKGFYEGEIADKITGEMKKTNGIISYSDLSDYEAKEREVISGNYRGYQIISMGPPSSGGISLIYLLNILENYDLGISGYGSLNNIHLMTEAMRRVFADRSEFMGDIDFVNVPSDILTSKVYAERRMLDYSQSKATPSKDVKPGDAYYRESNQTTHYSIADGKGNLISVTTTINDIFGNKVVVDGAGFFLNNEMDDFAIKPGVQNIYGLTGNEANAVEPGKRMLSSMTPVILFKDNKPYLVAGSPGGGKIITTVLQTIVNLIDYKMNLAEAINSPRFHHQWIPDEIQMEKNFSDGIVRSQLESMGYSIREINDFGKVDGIIFNEDGSMSGYSDRRGSGKAVGY